MLTADQGLFLTLNHAFSGAAATWTFGALTWLGNGFVLALLILPLMAWRDGPAFRRHVVPLVVSAAATGVGVNLAKMAIGRPRPPLWAASEGLQIHIPFGVPIDGSMPSGHAQTAFGAAVYLSLVYPRGAPLLLAAACAVGLSRIALGVHFPSDVIIGAAVGAAGASMAFLWTMRRGKAPRTS